MKNFDLHITNKTDLKMQYLAVCMMVLNGQFKDGDHRRKELTEEGFDPDIVQAVINLLYTRLN